MLSVVTDAQVHDELGLDQLVCEGARRMLAAALEAGVDAYLGAHAAERDESGRRLVVGNGHARQRAVTTAAGAVAVRAPRVEDHRVDPMTGDRIRFRSAMAFKLLEAAQDRWRAVNGPHLVALVRAGARFDKGVMIERPDDGQEVAA